MLTQYTTIFLEKYSPQSFAVVGIFLALLLLVVLRLMLPLLLDFIGSKKKEKQVILITGASAGIGKETALRLIKDGHIVYGAARRLEKMKELVDAGGHAIAMDVSETEQVESGVERILLEQKRIDVLINNAAYGVYGSVEDVSIEDARRQFEVNIFGLASLTKAVIPMMREQRSGTIINVSSAGGKIYNPFGSWYHATKHALEGWSDCLRLELSGFGINVVVVEPGLVGTTEFAAIAMEPMFDRSKGGPYETQITNVANNVMAMMPFSSPPSVIADVMSKAVKSKFPKRRYVAGAFARPMMFVRSWFGDAFYDFSMQAFMMT